MSRLFRLLTFGVLFFGTFAATAAEPKTRRPMLVTIDDIPLGFGELHSDPKEREAIFQKILTTLQRHQVPAVGFVAWGTLAGPSDSRLLDLWQKAGYEIGNHTFGHLDHFSETSESFVADAEKGRAALAEYLSACGKKPRFFHFPGLAEGETETKWSSMKQYLDKTGQKNLQVTIDNQDWSFEYPWVTAKKAKNAVELKKTAESYQRSLQMAVIHHEKRGDALLGRPLPQIIRLHASAVLADQAEDLFSWLEKTGHRFAPADEVLADPVFNESYQFFAPFGCSLWDRIGTDRLVKKSRVDVEATLQVQVQAWSHGEIEKFCSVYSDDAVFISPTGLTRGRIEILERYKKRYPTGAAMGALNLEILEFSPMWGMEMSMLDDPVPGRVHGASAIARWTLTFPDKPATTGLTLLVFKHVRQQWLIVQDASM